MGSETLSQQQIDQLFSGGTPPERSEPESASTGDEIRVYDFNRPNLISKDRLRALEAKYGMLCKSIENWLMTRVRSSIELRLISVEPFSFGEFTLSLPNPTASYIYDSTTSSGQQIVIDFGRTLSFFLVDRLLGSNEPPLIPDRALTVLERMVVRIAADQVAAQLEETWKSHVNLGLQFNRFEAVPELLRTANREDPILVANVEVHGPQLEGMLLLAVPFHVIEPFLTGSGTQRLQAGRGSDKDRVADRAAIEEQVRATRVGVTVRTSAFHLPVGDLARLRPGFTLRTGLPADPSFVVRVEDAPRYIAQAGRTGRSLAVRIVELHPQVSADEDATHRRVGTMASIVDNEGPGNAGLELNELDANGSAAAGPLSNIFQVTLPITIELGRTRMTVQEVLELGRGSVITLERLVGEPVDVIVGDRRFADGEVVVIGEQFGVRITRIHAPQPAPAELP